MSRRLEQPYLCSPLAELSRQLRFSPVDRRIEQVRRTERLHDQIDPQATYPLDYLWYRITGHRRPARDEGLLLVGAAVLPDLRLMIDELSRSVDLPRTEDDALFPEEVAQRLTVSERTLMRWRKHGLRWRWVVTEPGGNRRIAFTPAALDHFQLSHRDRTQAATRFSRIATETRDQLPAMARAIRERCPDASLHTVARELADALDRSVQAIRQALEKHDRTVPPDQRLFPPLTGPLTTRQKQLIERAARRRIPIQHIADHVQRHRSVIYRVLYEQRAQRARRQVLAFVPQPTFERPDADAVYLRPIPPQTAPPETGKLPSPPTSLTGAVAAPWASDLPEPLRPLYAVPSLGEDGTRTLLLRYHYLLFKASGVQKRLQQRGAPRAEDLDTFETFLKEADDLRERLIHASLPLVLSIVRRHLLSASIPSLRQVGTAEGPDTRNSLTHLVDLLLVGHAVLFDVVSAYDARRPATFESFLTNRLLQRLATEGTAGHAGPLRAHRRWTDAEQADRLRRAATASGVTLPTA